MIGPAHRRAAWVAVVGLVAVQVATCANRYLVNDDYQLLFTAWQRAVGLEPGRDFYVTSFSPLFDAFIPLFRAFPESYVPAYAGRVLMLVSLLAVGLLSGRLARAFFGEAAGLVAPVLYLSSIAVLHRGIDVRPDLLTTVAWLWAFVIVVERPAPSLRVCLGVGVIVGVALVNRFKGAVVLPPLAGLVVWQFVARHGRGAARPILRAGLAFGGGLAIPMALVTAWLWATGTLETFGAANLRLAGDAATLAGQNHGLVRETVEGWLRRDLHLTIALAAALVLTFRERRSLRTHAPALVALLVLATAATTLNPAFYSYNLVTLVALAVPFAAWPLGRLIEASARRGWVLVGAALVAAPAFAHPRWAAHYALEDTISHQRDLSSFLVAHTAPDARVFAMEGVGLFRRSNFHWRLPGILLHWYRKGDWTMRGEWEATPPEIFVRSYRQPDWLTPADRAWVAEHYVPLTKHLDVPGHAASQAGVDEPFELVVEGTCELVAATPCDVDGLSRMPNSTFHLARGRHTLRSPEVGATVRRAYSAEAKAMVANPRGLEYLRPPELMSLPGQGPR